ncbi:MAG: AraC family transcriptional regulator [Eubacteriales bacterium]
MFEIFDSYCWTRQKKVLTKNDHHIQGLGNFSYWNYTTSVTPAPPHLHSDIIEIHCMIKGTRFTQIEKDGAFYNYTTTGNEAMIVFPFEIHSNGTKPMAPCEFFAFQIDISKPDQMLGLNPEYSRALIRSLMAVRSRQLRLTQTHFNYLRSAFNFFSERNEESNRIGVQFLTAFLFTLQFLQPVKEQSAVEIDPGIKNALNYVRDNIHAKIRLSELADRSGYSLSRFKVKFKESIGVTPAEYVTVQKLEYAKRELIQTDKSITDIAFEFGFSTSNYFCSVFKKLNFITPKEYRKFYYGKGIRTSELQSVGAVLPDLKENTGTGA